MPTRHTCAHTHSNSHSHACTQLAFSNMPDIAFLMLAQEIMVASWSALLHIRGAGGQAPASARVTGGNRHAGADLSGFSPALLSASYPHY